MEIPQWQSKLFNYDCDSRRNYQVLTGQYAKYNSFTIQMILTE